MKTISSGLAQHLAGEVSTLATCWQVTRSSATPMRKVEATEIVAAAREWLGTPRRYQGRFKGVAVDCGGLIIGIGKDLGLLDFDTRAYGLLPTELSALCERHFSVTPMRLVDQIRFADLTLGGSHRNIRTSACRSAATQAGEGELRWVWLPQSRIMLGTSNGRRNLR